MGIEDQRTAVVIADDSRRVRAILEALTAAKVAARGFTDGSAALRYLDEGGAVLVATRSAWAMDGVSLCRQAIAKRAERAPQCVLLMDGRAPLRETDREIFAHVLDAGWDPDAIVAVVAPMVPAVASAPVVEKDEDVSGDEGYEDDDAPFSEPVAAARSTDRPWSPGAPKPAAPPARAQPAPEEPHDGVARPSSIADMLARYSTRGPGSTVP